MKKLFWIMIAALSVCVFAACSNDDEPQPASEKVDWLNFNKDDSLFIVDICNMIGDSANWGLVTWTPEDPRHWGGTSWDMYDEREGYRLIEANIYAQPYMQCRIPTSIKNCEYLQTLRIRGGISHIPQEVCELPRLTTLCIQGTNITRLPDDIFNEDLAYVAIEDNINLATALPKSITKLTDKNESGVRSYFSLWGNAFRGAIPPITKGSVILIDNNLTSYTLTKENMEPGPGKFYAQWNKLKGELPQEIMADTVVLYEVYYQLWDQKEGYGITNLPHYEVMEEMKDKWNKNHPDQKL